MKTGWRSLFLASLITALCLTMGASAPARAQAMSGQSSASGTSMQPVPPVGTPQPATNTTLPAAPASAIPAAPATTLQTAPNTAAVVAPVVQPAAILDTAAKAIRPIYLSSRASSYDIAPNIRVFEAKPGSPDFRQAITDFRQGLGKTTNSDQVFLGYSAKGYWLVFGVYNRNPSKSHWVLDLGSRLNGSIGIPNRIAVFTDADPSTPIMTDGRAVFNKKHLEGQERNAIPLNFDPGQPRIVGVYIEPAAGASLSIAPQLEEPAVFNNNHDQIVFQHNIAKIGAVLFGVVMMIFWMNYKNVTPLYLILYTATQYMIFAASDELVAYGNNTRAMYMHWLRAVSCLAALALSKAVLVGDDNRNKYNHLINLLMTGIILLLGLGASLDALGDFIDTVFLRLAPIAIPGLVVTIGTFTVLRTERPQSLTYTFGWALLLGGALLTEATLAGISSFTITGINFYWICFVLHLLIISFAALRFVALGAEMQRQESAEMRRKQEEDAERAKTKEIADQTRMLGVLQREKELMADLRAREVERIQAMRRAKETADQANKAKSDFLAVISHEIRTPMTGVMGMIRLLLDTPLNEKQLEYAKTIQYSGDALITLLNDILDLSKVEEGKMTIENVDFDLGKLVESVILLMSGRAEEKKIGLKAELDPDTPLMLKGDPTRIRQILLNLVGNAIKFTEKGAVTVIVKAHDKTAKKPRIYFAVKDSGIGISEEGQKKLFQPYQQAEASTTRKFGGTGLGLAICKRLVEAMGSTIQIASKMGEGTVFYFILTMEYGVADAESAAAAGVIPLKILVVDDNIINQRVVLGLLEKDRHKVTTVGGAEAALTEIKNNSYDIVFMDMEMPQIDGVMATQMIRRLPDPVKSKISVVAMTGNTGAADIERARNAGMEDYVTKPVNPEALRKLLVAFGRRKYPNAARTAAAAAANAPNPAPVTAPQPAATAPAAPQSASHMNAGRIAPQPVAQAAPAVAAPAPVAPVPAAPEPLPAPQTAAPLPAPDMAQFEAQHLFNSEVLGGLKDSLGKEQMDEMMDSLYQKTEELIGGAEKAVQSQDTKALQGFGHDIKGMTSNFGLTAVADLASRLERQAKENYGVDVLADIVRKLRPTYYDTRTIVDKWMKAG